MLSLIGDGRRPPGKSFLTIKLMFTTNRQTFPSPGGAENKKKIERGKCNLFWLQDEADEKVSTNVTSCFIVAFPLRVGWTVNKRRRWVVLLFETFLFEKGKKRFWKCKNGNLGGKQWCDKGLGILKLC